MGGDVQDVYEPASAGSQEYENREAKIESLPSNLEHERVWIRYRTQYRNRKTNDVVWQKDSRTPIDDSPEGTNSFKDPIFEVLTTYSARSDATPAKRSSRAGNTPTQGPPPRSLGTPASYKLRIYSPAILNALNAVVQYYPSQSLSGDVLEVNWPYPVLVHHYDQLLEFRKQVLSKNPSDLCVRETSAGEDLQALLGYLDQTVMSDIKDEKSRLERGYMSFEHTWYSHRPGTTYLTQSIEDPHWRAWVIKEVSGGTFVDPPQPWRIRGWSLAFNGLYLDRISQSITVLKFSGEKALHDTRFVTDTMDITDEEAIKLIEYGKSYWDLVQKQCKYHIGDSRVFPYNKVRRLTTHLQHVDGGFST